MLQYAFCLCISRLKSVWLVCALLSRIIRRLFLYFEYLPEKCNWFLGVHMTCFVSIKMFSHDFNLWEEQNWRSGRNTELCYKSRNCEIMYFLITLLRYILIKKANELYKLKKCQINCDMCSIITIWHISNTDFTNSSFILYICMSSDACIYILCKGQSL